MTTYFPGAPSAGNSLGALIQEVVLTAGETSFTFNSIPQAYRDLSLWIRGTAYNSGLSREIRMRFNGDTGANYDYTVNQTHGATADPFGAVAQTSIYLGKFGASGATVGYRDIVQCMISEYRSDDRKACMGQCAMEESIANPEGLYTQVLAQWWRGQVPITQLEVFVAPDGGFVTDTRLSLYGVT